MGGKPQAQFASSSEIIVLNKLAKQKGQLGVTENNLCKDYCPAKSITRGYAM